MATPAEIYFSCPTPGEREFRGLGRDSLMQTIQKMHAVGAALLEERNAYLENLTATQKRCTELLLAFRASKAFNALGPEFVEPLAQLVNAIVRARELHPRGCELPMAIVEEVGEVCRAMRRETPERVREELLDVAVVAMRCFMGEIREVG